MLNEEQARSIKVQLIEQIESSFPEERKQFAISQIEAMDSEALESFLVKNGLVKNADQTPGKCVFCSIVFGDIQSYKIAENSKAIAVLEINPLSKGHTIIIPKEHNIFGKEGKDIPKEISLLSKKVSEVIKRALMPEKISISNSNILGHEIINIIPSYSGKESSERKPASTEELEELKGVLTKIPSRKKTSQRKKPEKEGIKKKVAEEIKKIEHMWLPKRIP